LTSCTNAPVPIFLVNILAAAGFIVIPDVSNID
jgi:hypothetical protein